MKEFLKVTYHGFTAIGLGKVACAIRSQKLLDKANEHKRSMMESMRIFYEKHPEFKRDRG